MALICLIAPTAATTAGQVVVYGGASGTHLTLSVSGNRLQVDGWMGNKAPVGCTITKGHDEAVCDLSGVDQVEVVTGNAGDFVEVADPLPVPLVAHLGGGSDKFIGNAEVDTCYSEGARRNRCVGGAGDDLCWTGNQNSDCVGGPGNDVCRHGAGSDGCWGGPGNDVCIMGAGQDGCHGEAGDDKLYGGPDPDQLYGGTGDNYCNGLPGVGKEHECRVGRGR